LIDLIGNVLIKVMRWCLLAAAVTPRTGKIIKNGLNVLERGGNLIQNGISKLDSIYASEKATFRN